MAYICRVGAAIRLGTFGDNFNGHYEQFNFQSQIKINLLSLTPKTTSMQTAFGSSINTTTVFKDKNVSAVNDASDPVGGVSDRLTNQRKIRSKHEQKLEFISLFRLNF